MTKTSNPQSQKRSQESLSALFIPLNELKDQKTSMLFIKSSSDEGVIRNGGRNGARFAPQSFLSYFQRLTQDETTKFFHFSEIEMASAAEEKEDFPGAQIKQAHRLTGLLRKFPRARICHLGGGHDHIFPLLMALGETHKRIVVINVDAHADTRTDETFHSGTPFRQFSDNFNGSFHLFQIGLHPFANSFSTLSPLSKNAQSILWRKDVSDKLRVDAFFEKIQTFIDENTCVLFSLDADALDATCVPGVSAVNGDGLSKEELRLIWERYVSLELNHPPLLGLYELNPIFDSLSMTSMRTLGNFIFETLK